MIDRGKKNVLGIGINAIDYEAAVKAVIAAAQSCRPLSVTALAVHGVMTGVLDAEHRFRLNQFDLCVPDGQPVRWALNSLYHAQLSDRVYGPTLTLLTCEAAAAQDLPVFFYGSRPEVLAALQSRLLKRFPALRIAGIQPSRFRPLNSEERNEALEGIRASGAKITFVGLGCPRQEVWCYENRDDLGMPVLAVGAAFDFHAGLLPQAPLVLQRVGLEWFFRLVQEPRRLWRRYLYLNPAYTALVVAQASGKDFSHPGTRPTAKLRYG